MAGGADVAGTVEDDAIAVITETEVVCETCGSGNAPHLIANCAIHISIDAKERQTGHTDPSQIWNMIMQGSNGLIMIATSMLL